MTAHQRHALHSAIAPLATDFSLALSASALKCPLPSATPQQHKTNPIAPQPAVIDPTLNKTNPIPVASVPTLDKTNPPCATIENQNSKIKNPSLPPRQLSALHLLLAGHTAASVARTLNVNERTVRRWLANPLFRSEADRLAPIQMSATVPVSLPPPPVKTNPIPLPSYSPAPPPHPTLSPSARICPPPPPDLHKRTQLLPPQSKIKT